LAKTGDYSSTVGTLDSSLLTFVISVYCVGCYAVEQVSSRGGRTFVIELVWKTPEWSGGRAVDFSSNNENSSIIIILHQFQRVDNFSLS